MKEYLWCISEIILTGKTEEPSGKPLQAPGDLPVSFIQFRVRVSFFSVDRLESIFRTDKQ